MKWGIENIKIYSEKIYNLNTLTTFIADNSTSYYKTIMKPVKGGQGPVWAVAPLIIIINHFY
jgi:hypothetical protein